jgi:hypothetical protein
MDETLALALRVFLATIAPRVSDPAVERALEKVNHALGQVAQGHLDPDEGAAYIRDVITVLS